MFGGTDSPTRSYFGQSRRDSDGSQANSTYSATPSTRNILGTQNMNADYLGPPSAVPLRSSSPAPSAHSLTAHYLPSKFSSTLVSRKRGALKTEDLQGVVPRGGGVEAFRSGLARMPGAGDEDYDGVDLGRRGKKRLRWTRFKARFLVCLTTSWLTYPSQVILFVANIIFTLYSLCALIFTLLTWFRTLSDARILIVANHTELIFSTVAAAFAFGVSLIGFPGILLNNRPFLAVYTFLLWVTFGLLVVPGYITYKRRNLNLEGKINQQWSQDLGAEGRLIIQNALHCCGYDSPFVEATVSATCYSRSILPGCKADFFAFQKMALERWYTVSFGLVPVHIGVIVAGLLCSNHVTYRFGKGMMPKAYRLSKESMAVIMDRYAAQLSEQYGSDAAAHLLAANASGTTTPGTPYGRGGTGYSTSDINLMSMPFAQHDRNDSGGGAGAGTQSHAKYDSVGARVGEDNRI
ncbi:hypothetical protein HMN09_01087200 [Mycena chlorophos]|uniref:Tetraspanin Tsp2 family n=1 Tax=Mycena chlorophos TaxID=658473 RepID=A0A8H6SCF4_MYCCL|nr:hypothetical protein HMN09_01087200 [Mycena chlorophos]